MGAYRAIWGTAMAVVTVAALVGCDRVGLSAVLGATVALTVLGAMTGVAWAAIDRQWRLVGLCALWGALSGPLLVGLPAVIGGWALLALLLLCAGAPPLARRLLSQVAGRRPVRAAGGARSLSDDELRRRWRRTSRELGRSETTSTVALRLVEERALLLDEIERRDPAAFEAQLIRAGWRSGHPATDL